MFRTQSLLINVFSFSTPNSLKVGLRPHKYLATVSMLSLKMSVHKTSRNASMILGFVYAIIDSSEFKDAGLWGTNCDNWFHLNPWVGHLQSRRISNGKRNWKWTLCIINSAPSTSWAVLYIFRLVRSFVHNTDAVKQKAMAWRQWGFCFRTATRCATK